jgi:D-3-phosphoglycerate dehydrogenase
MKIYVLDALHPSGVEYAEQRAEVVRWNDPRVKNWHEDADGLMVRGSQIRAADFARAKKLRVISKQGVGIDNIDVNAARAHGVTVCRTPGINSEAVAELALTLGLCVTRRVAEFDRRIHGGEIVERANILGLEMMEKTVGIVGMGNIGTRVARKWRGAFDARILAYDPYVPADHWPDIQHERVASLADMLPRVDILTLHLPLTDESRRMIGADAFARMKPTAVLVNAARGGIVDEAALYQAIVSGRLYGAGLDVFEQEPPTTANPLLQLPTVVVTPHAGAGTHDTQIRSSMRVAEQLFDALEGREPLGRVA